MSAGAAAPSRVPDRDLDARGVLEDGIGLGEHVHEGQVLARVVDPYGDLIEEIRAPSPAPSSRSR